MQLPGAVYIVNIENWHYYETILAYIWLALKRYHVIFVGFDQIILLKYDSFRPVPKYEIVQNTAKSLKKIYIFLHVLYE